VEDAAYQHHSSGEVGATERDEQRHGRAGAAPEEVRRAADHVLEERDRVLRHQLVGDRALDVGRAPVAAPLRGEDVEARGQRLEVRCPGPSVGAARVQQHKRLALAGFVVPGAYLSELYVAGHRCRL
jgi:hypothetical protein